MNDRQFARKTSPKVWLAYVYAVGLFALTAYFGVAGPGDYAESTTTLQKLCSVVVTAYGVLGVIALIGLLSKRTWAPLAAIGWGLMIVAAAVLAPAAWAPEDVSTLSLALGALLAAALAVSVYLIVKRLVHTPR